MKIMSRDFTRSEKILIALLALILVGLVYYRFVYVEVNQAIANAEAEQKQLQKEIDKVEQQILYLKGIQNEMDKLEAEGRLSWMSSYNNSKAEVAFLNDILANTRRYSISFANVTRKGDQIRRSFTLQYQTVSYDAAQEITRKLCESENRCVVSDIRCAIADNGYVTVNESATFYETMVGGEADAGLPSDSAKANS